MVDVWIDEHKRWSERDLSAKSYVYVWADGVYLQARLEDEAQCILVIIGATPEGKKELLVNSVCNGHYECICHQPLFVFNQFGVIRARRTGLAMRRPGFRRVGARL